MSSPDTPKLCTYCGADVTHQDRYKNRDGQYVCPPCRESRTRRSSRYRRWLHRVKKWRKWAAYALAAALAAAIFLFVLKFFADALSGPAG